MRTIYRLETGVTRIKNKAAQLTNRFTIGVVTTLGISGLALLPAAHAAMTTTVVTPTNFNTIFNKTDVRPVSSYNFVAGPATPPLGSGSLELTTVDNGGKQQHLETQQLGTTLSSIDAMGYSTYRHSDSTATAVQVPSINMEVSTDGQGGGYTTLVFEPVYNTNQGTVTDNTWQSWDAYAGGNAVWWSSHAIPGVCAFDCFVSWSDIVAANPDAVVLSYGVNQGTGNTDLHANVDALSIGAGGNTTTYNFEQFAAVTDKDACKDGGWMNQTDANGNGFKNQGACVSYVASNGKSQH